MSGYEACLRTLQPRSPVAVNLPNEWHAIVETPAIREERCHGFLGREFECHENVGCQVDRHADDVDTVPPFWIGAVGAHPDEREFDQMIRPEPVTGACHGHKFADYEVTQHFCPSFAVENYRHGYTFMGAQNRRLSVQGGWLDA